MKYSKHKQLLLLFGFLIPTIWCGAHNIAINDGFSHINIKGSIVQGFPRENSIQASISGHVLAVVFLENLGQVAVEVTTANGDEYYGEFEVTD